MTHKLEETTIRDFGGGWDVSDSDKSLGSKYQPISDNMTRRTDGSLRIRPGTRLFADLRLGGTETVHGPASHNASASVAVDTPITRIAKSPAGGPTTITVGTVNIVYFINGSKVTISGGTGAGMTNANGLHVISNVNLGAGTFQMVGVDTSAASGDQTTGTMKATNAASAHDVGYITINYNGHGLTTGNHINITQWTNQVAGIQPADILGVHGVVVNDANYFSIYVRKAASGTQSVTTTITWTKDNYVLGGTDIYGRYFNDKIYVFSDIGEIATIDRDGIVASVWNVGIASAQNVQPWGPCRRISAEIMRGHLVAVNGATNDMPLDITGSGVKYLGNETGAVGGIRRADFIIAASRYVMLISTGPGGITVTNGPTYISISARDTYYVFTGDANPADAVDIDLGLLTQSTETVILGANVIRDRVFIAFTDRSLLGELGIYDSAQKHQPDFKDVVAKLGTFAHHSVISLGNDMFTMAMNGVNSLAVSTSSGEFTPATISDLIHPVMLRHFGRLLEDDRRYKTFAVWDATTHSYMLFAPKYSDVTDDLPDDPIIVSDTLQPHSLAYLQMPSHTYDAGDYVTLAGLTASPDGAIPAGNINGVRKIRSVVDANTVVIEIPDYPPTLNYGFGGLNGTCKPISDETPGYVFEYNSRLKIKRWTRYRGMSWRWGAVSQLGDIYFGNGAGRIYRYGNTLRNYSADRIGDYTKSAWFNSTAYVPGDRVLDAMYKTVFLCLVAHTSSSSSTFVQDRTAHPDYWEEFKGVPINWEVETAWTDFKARVANKQIEFVRFDTEGASEFEFSIYTNGIRTDFESFDLIPRRTTIFIGQDAPGFGAGTQPYGGGRNTRQEWLRGMPVEGKLFRLRFAGSSVEPLVISSVTMYYHKKPTALT